MRALWRRWLPVERGWACTCQARFLRSLRFLFFFIARVGFGPLSIGPLSSGCAMSGAKYARGSNEVREFLQIFQFFLFLLLEKSLFHKCPLQKFGQDATASRRALPRGRQSVVYVLCTR